MNTPVSFELAKILKEKEFDEPCIYFFTENRELYGLHPAESYNGFTPKNEFDLELDCKYPFEYNNVKAICKAPTVAEVMMWLYEKHSIWVKVTPIPYSDNLTHWRWEHMSVNYSTRNAKWEKKQDYMSPTEAYEAAIEYCLINLI